MFKTLLLYLLIQTSVLANTFVNGPEDFYIHMKNHVNNVQRLGQEVISILEQDPKAKKAFMGLRHDFELTPRIKLLAQQFLQVHDASKINVDPKFFNKYHVTGPGANELYSIYGKTYEQMSESEKQIIIKRINGIDEQVRANFIKANKVTADEMTFLDQLEKFADLTERGSNPVTSEEIGKKALPASDYMEKVLKNNHSHLPPYLLENKLNLFKRLESIYPKVAVPYIQYKTEIVTFRNMLFSMGTGKENLRQYGDIELFEYYKKNAPKNVSADKFFLENDNNFDLLKSFHLKDAGKDTDVGMEMARYQYFKKNDITRYTKFTRLFDTLAGECAH